MITVNEFNEYVRQILGIEFDCRITGWYVFDRFLQQ